MSFYEVIYETPGVGGAENWEEVAPPYKPVGERGERGLELW